MPSHNYRRSRFIVRRTLLMRQVWTAPLRVQWYSIFEYTVYKLVKKFTIDDNFTAIIDKTTTDIHISGYKRQLEPAK